MALLAKRGALAEAKLRYFHPIPAMLAAPAASAADAMERLSEIAAGAVAVEDKYDGIRVQLHLHEGQVALFGRDANDITVAFLRSPQQQRNSLSHLCLMARSSRLKRGTLYR